MVDPEGMPEVGEAAVADTPTGRVPQGEGWFVVNVGELSWERHPASGVWCSFEAPDAPFAQYGIGVHVLEPGQASGLYHAESDQEGFLVLAGECLAIVEGQERRLRQWDYLHCPPGTHHITVGAGDGPCVILMVGTRGPDVAETEYTVDELAARYGASVARATTSSDEAYADLGRSYTAVPAPWPPNNQMGAT
jgi:uncharacterized cupin superfamily protein